MTHLERFLAVMEYGSFDRVPNWEAGAWPQTRQRWRDEGAPVEKFQWQWFPGEAALGMDPREFVEFDGKLLPSFTPEVLEEDERTQVIRDRSGRVRRALKAGAVGGTRMSMDQFLRFAVTGPDDWADVKRRLDPTDPRRYEPNWSTYRPAGWKARQHPLIFAPNTMTPGFFWTARELMGTEGLAYAWYDQPSLMHDMMEHIAHFLIEAARPVLEATTIDYICLAEDLAMKTGPLLSPATFREFIFPRLKRVAEFYKSHGVRYLVIDTDGNFEAVIPMMLDAGVDATWPLERAADMDPVALRKKFGRSMRLWGGVDKREMARGRDAIVTHLRTLQPLVAEGGFIPTVDHTVPPDVSWDDFRHYWDAKAKLLDGTL